MSTNLILKKSFLPIVRMTILAMATVSIIGVAPSQASTHRFVKQEDPKPKKKKKGESPSQGKLLQDSSATKLKNSGAIQKNGASRSASGGAYNGPVTSGASIPTYSDREITLETLSGAIRHCVKDLAGSLLRQALTAPESSEPRPASTPVAVEFAMKHGGGESFPEVRYSVSYDMGEADQYAYIDMNFNQTAMQSGMSDAFQSKGSWTNFLICRGAAGDVENRKCFSTSFSFPIVVFDDTITEGSYDEFGTLSLDQVVVRNLRLLGTPSTYGRGILGNSSTGRPTSLVVDFDEYRACLLSKVTQ
jgi:hypothetical protein